MIITAESGEINCLRHSNLLKKEIYSNIWSFEAIFKIIIYPGPIPQKNYILLSIKRIQFLFYS